MRLPLRHRPLFAAGAVAVCAITVAAAAPAYARPTAPAVRPAASPDARVSGQTVAGTLTGAAARRATGTAAADFLREHRQLVANAHAGKNVAPDGQLHAWWGSFPNTNSGTAVIATQSISQTLRLSNKRDILYAPTMTPADNSCIEVVTVHTTKTPQIWAWDWCDKIAPVAVVPVTSAFMAKYTAIINGRTSYTTEDVQTNASKNTWTARLFNYQTGSWDTLWTQSGKDKSGLTFGWDMFEFYSFTNKSTGNTYVCGDLQKAGTQIESSSISIRQGSTWHLAGPSNSSWNPEAKPTPSAYRCPDMKFNIVQDNSAWMVDVAGS